MPADRLDGFATELRARGYAVLPAPRQVHLKPGTTRVQTGWGLALDHVQSDDIAHTSLLEALLLDYGVHLLNDGQNVSGAIVLSIQPGAVAIDADPLCEPQAYRLTIASDRVEVVGNGRPGLFYGVQTLLQLLAGPGPANADRPASGVLPLGEIRDWPSFPLRIAHWDTKHHQDRPETLRRYIDQLAQFKMNAVAFELEDKFEYPSHPAIGAPGAFTTAELHELVRYGLERHLQIIPNIQAPAHMAYVLKHPEFAHLRCDGSNYQSCMDDPAALRLIFDMYDDMLKATEGVDYFLVSTDEIYYAGICEKYRKPFSPETRGQTWCAFANKANDYLRQRGRRVIMWVEWPLRAEDVATLSPDIIDGIIGTDDVERQLAIENQRGMRQLCYVSMQGAGKMFPNYFAGAGERGRLADAFAGTTRGKGNRGRPIGTFSAAWDDTGLHNEMFWLGWGAMAQCSWTPGLAQPHQMAADFVDVFYGREAVGLIDVYRDLQHGSQFWEAAWDREISKERPPAYGNSDKKVPSPRYDLTLQPPALPELAAPAGLAATANQKTLPLGGGKGEGNGSNLGAAAVAALAVQPRFKARYAHLLSQLPQRLADSDRLIGALHANLTRVRRNRYNLHVLLTVAHLQRHFLELLATCERIEGLLVNAAAAHAAGDPAEAVNRLRQAHDAAGRIIDDLDETYARVKSVWEVSRFEKGRSVGGRQFVHIMDDVKDHGADRRADLTYLIVNEQRMDLPGWRKQLGEIIRAYSQAVGVAAKIDSPHE